MRILYNIFLFIYHTAIRIASIWNKKAALWIKGREGLFEKLQEEFGGKITRTVWFHCSSLGEFEQARPLIDRLKSSGIKERIVLSFFSPSGYEVRKNYHAADFVFYLPPDGKENARKLFALLNPSLVIFVKYDYWYYYLSECKQSGIPLLMISALFTKRQAFFKWYGGLHRRMLNCISHFFVQDEHSRRKLETLNFENITVSGDTRFDRVNQVVEEFKPYGLIEEFCGDEDILIAGSTWPPDEKLIAAAYPAMKLIIAPHEITKHHLNELKKSFKDSILYSELLSSGSGHGNKPVLIIDNIGMLSSIYKYATIAYVGGGFSKGIHNILEPAAYGKPVLFGPRHQKFREAIELITVGGGYCVKNRKEFEGTLSALQHDKKLYKLSAVAAETYIKHNKGATNKIMDYIQMKRLLTRL